MDKKLPCVAIVTSGGGGSANEGVLALLQMVKTVASARQMSRQAQPYIALLGNPCTGAAYVSFVAQADIILAEPKARIGFASAQYLSDGIQSKSDTKYNAEAVASWGQIDGVVSRTDVRQTLGSALSTLTSYKADADEADSPDSSVAASAPSKSEGAPTAKDYLDFAVRDFVSVNRHAYSAAGSSVICGFGRLGDHPAALIAVNTEPGDGLHLVSSGDLRKVARLARLANKFELPIAILVDSCFAAIGVEHEREGIAKSISRVIATLGEVEVPTLSVLIGDVGSETTLSLSIADHIIMLSHAKYILNTANERADLQVASPHLSPQDCLELGIVDQIINVPPQRADLVKSVSQAAADWLARVTGKKGAKLVVSRSKRFRNIDESYLLGEARIKRQWDAFQVGIKAAVQSLRSGEANPDNAEIEP